MCDCARCTCCCACVRCSACARCCSARACCSACACCSFVLGPEQAPREIAVTPATTTTWVRFLMDVPPLLWAIQEVPRSQDDSEMLRGVRLLDLSPCLARATPEPPKPKRPQPELRKEVRLRSYARDKARTFYQR